MNQSVRPGICLLVMCLLAGTVPVTSTAHDVKAAQGAKPKPAPRGAAPAKPVSKPPEPAPAPEPPPPIPQQWQIVTRYTSGDQSSSLTSYAAGARQRVDLAQGAVVTQCDLSRAVQVNDVAKAYATVPLVAPDASPDAADAADAGGRILVRTTVTDTGEKREIHGHSARRLRIVTTTEPDAQCDVKKSTVETDGWYADVPELQVCALAPARPPAPEKSCREVREAGAANGFPLIYASITRDAAGTEVSRVAAEVTALTREPRDEALFDTTAGYAAVADVAALAAAARRAELEALGTTPKADGMIRIGVALPTDSSGRGVDRDALGNELLEAFSDAPIEAVPVLAVTPSEQEAEAKAKECDFLLRTDLAQLTTSAPGRLGGLVRRASGGGNPSQIHEARIAFELSALRAAAAPRKHAASAKTGSFTWRRAVGLARFAGRIYMGMTAGVMQTMLAASNAGGTAGDPTLNALSTLFPADKGEDEPHSPEAVVVAAVDRGATDLKRTLVPKKAGGWQ